VTPAKNTPLESTRGCKANPADCAAEPLLKAFSAREIFPGRAQAITSATNHFELARAAWRYAFASMFARHATRRPHDLARTVVINDVESYARKSQVRPRLPKRYVAAMVVRADDAARDVVGSIR